MKPSRISLTGLVIALMIATPAFAWVQEPIEETGYYYMYDDAEENPPFSEPELPPLPEDPYSNYTIHDNPESIKLEPYNDRAYRYEIVDSFWYFGYWYRPENHIYLSPDGWLSFDEMMGTWFPVPETDPPLPNSDDPNELIAPLWGNYNPTATPEPSDSNRVYCLYDEESKILTVEWYKVKYYEKEHEYSFLATIQLGGRDLLVEDEHGVLYSGHLIHFLYNVCSNTWNADRNVAGIEGITGDLGIYYQGNIDTETDSFHVVRAGYMHPRYAIAEKQCMGKSRYELDVINAHNHTDRKVSFSLPHTEHVQLDIFDVTGRHISNLTSGTYTSGTHTLTLTGQDAEGRKVSQGMYLVRMKAGAWSDVKKVIILTKRRI